MTRVLYLNVHDASYPRNARIREFLAKEMIDYQIVARRDSDSFVATCWRLLRAGVQVRGPFDVVILSELGVQFALVARVVAWRHRSRLIVDGFVGMHESNVLDWNRVSPYSMLAKIYRAFDLAATRLAYGVLIDTDIRAQRLTQEGARRVVVLPVGAPAWAVSEHPAPKSERTRVLYYGNYIPLHGLPYVLQAIAGLKEIDAFDFTFIGEGEGRPPIEALAAELGLAERITFLGAVPESSLGHYIWNSHVILGIFGTSSKAATVLANKVWQGLSCGRVVVTRKSKALAELSGVVSAEQLLVVDPAIPSELTLVMEDVNFRRRAGATMWFPDSSKRLESYVVTRYRAFVDVVRGR